MTDDLWETAEDRCEVCGKLVGVGVRWLHLKRCDDHPVNERDIQQEVERGSSEPHLNTPVIDHDALMRSQPKCRDYKPDHNGECLNCDEGPDAHREELEFLRQKEAGEIPADTGWQEWRRRQKP